jgi:hypothetical protein
MMPSFYCTGIPWLGTVAGIRGGEGDILSMSSGNKYKSQRRSNDVCTMLLGIMYLRTEPRPLSTLNPEEY